MRGEQPRLEYQSGYVVETHAMAPWFWMLLLQKVEFGPVESVVSGFPDVPLSFSAASQGGTVKLIKVVFNEEVSYKKMPQTVVKL